MEGGREGQAGLVQFRRNTVDGSSDTQNTSALPSSSRFIAAPARADSTEVSIPVAFQGLVYLK